jgi:hypothetical protein
MSALLLRTWVRRGCRTSVLALLAAGLLTSRTAVAQTWEVAGAAGGELAVAPALTGHGFLFLQAARSETLGGTLRLTYNTDTVDVTLERLPLAERLELTVGVRGEALIAGLNLDYFQQGERLSERGFYASYVQGHARLQRHLPAHNTVELDTQVRRWWFSDTGSTADTLQLPQETWHAQVRLAWIYWNIQLPRAEWEAHRLFPRVTGFAFRVAAEMLLRGEAGAFGAEVAPGELDPRNDAGRGAATVRLWAAGGTVFGPLRLAFELNGAWGTGHDDITRDRVGGLTPYVVRVPGLPWAALLSERYLVGEARLALALGDERAHELGVLVAAGVLNDPRRLGQREAGGLGGGALFADLRFGSWQIHAQGAMAAPVGWLTDRVHLSGLVGVGVRLK